MMKSVEFEYGSFSAVKKRDDDFSLDLNSEGEFKPVVLSEKQKAKIRRLAQKALKINEKKARKLKKIEEREKNRLEKLREKQKAAASKVKRPIGVKLISIISAIVVVALGGVTYLVSYFVSEDTIVNAQENNLTINTRTANDVESRIGNVVYTVQTFIEILENSVSANRTAADESAFAFFERNPDVAAIILPSSDTEFYNMKFLGENEILSSQIDSYVAGEEEAVLQAEQGLFVIKNASPFFNIPLVSIFYSLNFGKNAVNAKSAEKSAVVLYSSEKIAESFASSSINQSFFINGEGIVVAASDVSLMTTETNLGEYESISEMLSSKENGRQVTFTDSAGKEFIGAFRKTGFGNSFVATFVQTDTILEGVRATTRRNLYLTISILAVAIMIIYFFSKSLSVPLKQLTAVVNQINEGNFNTELFSDLKTNGKDEIGVLIKSTKNEREILNTFTKLTNKGVTQAIIKKEIDFEPHLKDITVFFSDIRGFTEISDGFKKKFGAQSAAEIINFLNDYMSRMVTCITRTGGTVDKFEGDAIMACWGVLRQEPLDWEKLPDSDPAKAEAKKKHDDYVKEDALSAIKSSLAMRYSLMEYNKEAAAFTKLHENDKNAEYKPQIKIGRGINTGRATVGFMGSYDKMEFTSIGDAVNFASRTEAANKSCGTDMLITEDTYNLLKKDYIKCPENRFFISEENLKNEIVVEKIPVGFEVKGKGNQHFYAVVNMPQFDVKEFFAVNNPFFEPDADCEKALGPKGPKTIREVRALLGIPAPDFEKVNLNEEENKIQVSFK